MKWRDLRLRMRPLLARRHAERDLHDELAFHLEMETRKHVASGLSPDEARDRARARFGSMSLAAEECRDARGQRSWTIVPATSATPFEASRRAPLTALTIVMTVASAWVWWPWSSRSSTSDVPGRCRPEPRELFAVSWPTGFDERVRLTRPQYEALRSETDVFSDIFAMLPDIDSRIDGRMMSGSLVTGNFFQVLGVNAALGRTLMPGDDERGAPRPVMVLSHRGWSRLFSNDPAVLGRSLVVNGLSLRDRGRHA